MDRLKYQAADIRESDTLAGLGQTQENSEDANRVARSQ